MCLGQIKEVIRENVNYAIKTNLGDNLRKRLYTYQKLFMKTNIIRFYLESIEQF